MRCIPNFLNVKKLCKVVTALIIYKQKALYGISYLDAVLINSNS